MPRTEVARKLWAYIKKNNLQDATERRMINADDKLKEVFGGKKGTGLDVRDDQAREQAAELSDARLRRGVRKKAGACTGFFLCRRAARCAL